MDRTLLEINECRLSGIIMLSTVKDDAKAGCTFCSILLEGVRRCIPGIVDRLGTEDSIDLGPDGLSRWMPVLRERVGEFPGWFEEHDLEFFASSGNSMVYFLSISLSSLIFIPIFRNWQERVSPAVG